MSEMLEILQRSPVIPVIVIDDLDKAVPLATALVKGGLNVLEITLRTEVALEAVKDIKTALPEAKVGTGTVIDLKSLNASIDVGADFMVSPGITDDLLNALVNQDVNFLPGAVTASEVMHLYQAGFDCLKFFPAEAAGGCNMLKSISGPLPQIKFCPTGGISMNNAASYLSLANVVSVGGSWMLDKQLIKDNNWQEITNIAYAICSELGQS